MAEKIIGYVLLLIGVTSIFFCAINVYKVLTKKEKPIEFLNVQAFSSDKPEKTSKSGFPAISLTDLLGLSDESFSLIINSGIHLLLVGFMARLGFHLASLGTMLVRPIVVDLKTIKPPRVPNVSNN